MESILQVVLVIICIAVIDDASAKIGITGSDLNLAVELPLELDNCREACLQKYSLDYATCSQAPVCTKCLDTCKTISHQHTIENQWTIRVASMIKQEFLVATHLAWEPTNKLINCLVTWEVFGGGLMGNLLTDSSNVELSLWPDTKYRVQVTCKNKKSGLTVKSNPLTIDTTNAIQMKPESSSETLSTPIIKIDNVAAFNDISTIDPADSEWKLNEIVVKQRRKLLTSEYDQRLKEVVLGMCAALIVFLFILTVLCASKRDPQNTKIPNNNTFLPNGYSSALLNEVICVDMNDMNNS